MLNSNSCNQSDAYILGKGAIAVADTSAASAVAKKIKIMHHANCISELNNTQVDNAQNIDIIMPMYNLIEYYDNYSKTSRSLWQYLKDIPTVNNNANIASFNEANATDLFNSKAKVTR